MKRSNAALAIAFTALVASVTGVAAATTTTATHKAPRAHAAALRGPRGPRGFRGPRGPAGPPGLANVTEVDGPELTLQPGDSNVNANDEANCPSGDVVIGTGWNGSIMSVGFVLSFHTFAAGFVFNDTNIPVQYHWQAICAKASGPLFARDATAERSRYAQMRRAALRASR